MKKVSKELKAAFTEMAAFTKPKCGVTCANRKPGGCCNTQQCLEVKEIAKEYFGVNLVLEGETFIKNGSCTVKPWLRPQCTMHTCNIHNMGVEPGETKEWHEKYFELRHKCENALFGVNSN